MTGQDQSKAWREWLSSPQGKSCTEGHPVGSYLENRLWHAFFAGIKAAAQECENESENLSGNNARTADACASRIRALISGDGQ